MKNRALTKDYHDRSVIRLAALKVLFEKKGYADVVREAQEIVELISKALLRHLGAEPARVHEVSAQLTEMRPKLEKKYHAALDTLIEVSRELRRDRELAFYGTEDLTRSEFYSKKDAARALRYAEESVAFVTRVMEG